MGKTNSDNFPVYSPKGEAYFQEKKAEVDVSDHTDIYEYEFPDDYDAFILKFNSKGKRLWATYYGGNRHDFATSISVDNNNNIYVVGYTFSTDFPVYNPKGEAYFQESNAGQNDLFILKFNSNGVRLWATYYGGSDDDVLYSSSIDKNNDVYLVGRTSSDNFPIYNSKEAYFQESNAGLRDAFILKFNSEGVRLWSTYYGGDGNDYATSVSIDNNNVYIAGHTESGNLPLRNLGENAYFQESNAGYFNAFILKFKSRN